MQSNRMNLWDIYVCNSHTTEQRNQRSFSLVSCTLPTSTPPHGFAGRRKPGLEVAGTNNYHLRSYDAKEAAATSTVDKAQRVRGDNCQDDVEGEERWRVFHCSTTFPLKYPLLQNPFCIIHSANKAFGVHSPKSCTNTSICPDYLRLSARPSLLCP